MEQWTKHLVVGLANKTSRRGVIGLAGRGIVALGAAAAGLAAARTVEAQTCGGGTCGSFGQCLGNILGGCPSSGCPGGYTVGWSWTCCTNGHDLYRCQDCCQAGQYQGTCEQYISGC